MTQSITIRRLLGRVLTSFGLTACLMMAAASSTQGHEPTVYPAEPKYAPPQTEFDKPLVAINGDTIFVSNLDDALMRFHSTLGRTDRANFDYRTLLDKLVEDYLIQQEASSLGLYEEEWLLKKLNHSRTKKARDLFLLDTFKPDLTIDEDKVLEFFNSNYFKMQIRTVAVDSLNEAIEVINSIKNGAAMDSIALAISFDSRKHKGGLHGLIYYANTENAFREIASQMKVGELSEPIPYSNSYIVMRLEQYLAPDTNGLPYFKPQIMSKLTTDKQNIAWDQFIDSLREFHPPTVFASAIDQVRLDSENLFSESFVKGHGAVLFEYDDDYAVTDNNLRKEISYAAMSDRSIPYDSLFDRSLGGLKTELLLNYTAASLGYMDSLAVLNAYYESLDSAVIEIYLSEVIVSQIKFNREEFDSYYNEHLDDFRDVERFQIAQIQFGTKDSADLFHTRLEAGAQFDYLFNKIDPNNNSGSESEQWVTLNNFPDEIQETITNLQVNKNTDVYQTSNGWIILYLKNRKAGRIREIHEVDKQLRNIMFKLRFDEAFNANLALLREHSDIIFFDDYISEYFN